MNTVKNLNFLLWALLIVGLAAGCVTQSKKRPVEESPNYIHVVQYKNESLVAITQWYTNGTVTEQTVRSYNPRLDLKNLSIGEQVIFPRSMVVRKLTMPEWFARSYNQSSRRTSYILKKKQRTQKTTSVKKNKQKTTSVKKETKVPQIEKQVPEIETVEEVVSVGNLKGTQTKQTKVVSEDVQLLDREKDLIKTRARTTKISKAEPAEPEIKETPPEVKTAAPKMPAEEIAEPVKEEENEEDKMRAQFELELLDGIDF